MKSFTVGPSLPPHKHPTTQSYGGQLLLNSEGPFIHYWISLELQSQPNPEIPNREERTFLFKEVG